MARNIIVFVADGLRSGSVNAVDTPTLYSVQQNGVNFTDSHSLFPTFTTPNASAIATGHYLGDTGDFSNTVYTGYPVLNSNGSVTPFIENDPILADINANSNLADPDASFSKNNFLTEESILAYARANGYSTAAIGKLGPVAIFDVGQDIRTGGAATPNITPATVIIDDSTYIRSVADATNPPVNGNGSQSGIPLSSTIANDFNAAGLIGQTVPGTTTIAATIGSIRSNQPAGNLTTAGTLNSNAQQQQFFADATTKAILPQFVSDIASKTSSGFAAVYWSRDPDGTQHNNGDAFNAADPGNNSLTIGINGPTAKKGVQDADANLKQIIDYLKATPDPANPGKTLYDNTDIFVTADHGFSTISKQAVGVSFDANGVATYINTTSYASTLNYYSVNATTGVQTPTVHAGFLPPGFVAIDLAHDLGSTLYDPNSPTAPVTAANIGSIQYNVIDPTKGQNPASGNGVIGGSGKVVNGVIDPNTQVVIAANGGSDLLYVPSKDKALVAKIVALLAQKDYISGIFTDDAFGDIPGALKMSTIGLEGTAELPTPSIAINFKTFSTNPNNPNDPQAQVEVADTTLQQGQGMHGSFGRGDTFNNMAAIGPDFKAGYVDAAPVSNADVVPTLASILGWTLPATGSLVGRVATEALVNGPALTNFSSATIASAPVNGQSTLLKTQTVGNTQYFDVAGFAGGTDGLNAPVFKTTGPSSSQSPYILPTAPGVKTTSILTVGDTAPNGYKMAGIPDGLGAFDNGDGTFTLLMNHEIGNTSGVVHASGGKGAFVSSWVINKSDLSVVSGGDLIQKVYNWDAAAQKSNTTTSVIDFNRFCSADLPAVSAFYNSATGLGTSERIFLNGEEGGATGYQLATVATGANKGNTYVLGKFDLSTNGSGLTGVGGWENALANPFAQDKTVVIGNNDGGTGIMNNAVAVYVGTKTKTGTEIDKAGLTNGTLKFVNVTGSLKEIVDTATRATNITDGTKFTLSDTASTTFSRPEDGAWNPSNFNQYFFVTTDQLDTVNDGIGTQVGRSRLWRLNFDDITNPDAGGTIDMLLDGTEGQNMFDNITVDRYGQITLLEDTGNAAHNGKTWQYDIATDKLTQLTKFDPNRFGDVVNGVATPATAPFTIDEETSGVIDVQDILGAGWSLIDVQAHYLTNDPTTVEGGQLLALYNPDIAKAAATAKNKVAFSGVAAGDATSNSEILWTRTVDAATKQGLQTNLSAQLSTDAAFSTIAKTFTGFSSDPLGDYTAKLDATGLQSGTQYYYRFTTSGGDTSGVGTFKTAPDAKTKTAVRFGFSGDADGLMRPYSSTQNFGSLKLDFFGFLGDTIYETASKGSAAAVGPVTDANASQALIDYHRKYLENIQPVNSGGFSGLETLFSSQGNYTLLDNHELGNKQLMNGGAPIALQTDPTTVNRNGTVDPAYDANTTGTYLNQTFAFKTLEQAYLDYQPVRENIISAPNDPRTDGTQQLYGAHQWGENLVYINTDTRSYRDARLKKADGTTDDTGARADNPDRTLLGKTQLSWLKQTLLDAQANGTAWKFVAVSDPIDQIGAIGSGADSGKSWIGGYRAERNELLKFIADNGIKNVVFLATDDHQNRINELTYLDNINDPTSIKVLPNALSVVDGPIGATGPDTITDHSFTNIKSLADQLAATQTAAGVNPVGLSPSLAGLKNVVREGDPNADTLRQPIDFYSPDTFNYTVFDISPDGKTLNVNVQGVNSSATNTFPEPSATNPVRSIISFSLDAAPATLQVTATTPTVAEASSTPGVFHVVADSIVTSPLTFGYTLGGTATNGADYSQLSGTATIAAGQSSVDIKVAPINDILVEGNENVTLTLQKGSGYTASANNAASITIIDDDKAVVTPPSVAQPQKNSAFSHVLVISIDGLHNSDLSVANLQSSLTNIKRLQSQGITFSNAFASAPSDSFPGELNYITGANPGTTGVFYDKSYSRALYAPGTTAADIANGTALSGTGVEFAENVDASWNNGSGGTLDGGQGFDTTQLPVDSNGNSVYPNQYLRVNTIFDVANAAGLRTAWSDKHPAAYTVLAGNTQDPTQFNFATGKVGSISDYSSLEINAATAIDPTKPGPLPTSLGVLVDQSTGTPYSNTNPNITSNFFNDSTKGNTALFKAPPTGFSANQFTSVATTSAFDDLRVKQILNEIDGLDHTGTTAAGTPSIFGLNLQAVSVGEKEPATLFNGGGIDANGNARADLVSAVAHTDASIGLILDELKKQGLDSSTLVVLTAKHGQNPVQDPTVGLSSSFDSVTGQAGGDGGLTAIGALLVRNGIELASENGGDTSSLLFLKNKADVAKAVALLNTKNYSFDTAKDLVSDPTGNTLFSIEDAAAQGTVLSGQAIINAGLGDPLTNDRTPDIVVPLNTGYFFGNATKKRSEHGGFTDADTHVALIAGSVGLTASLQGTTDVTKVSTTQIAPTVLEALGLDPNALQGVLLDGTKDLGISLQVFLPTLQVDVTTATATETNSTPGVFHISTVGNIVAPLTFNYTIGGTATNGVDYANLSGTATIAAGQSSVDIAVKPVDDTLVEGTETVNFTLSSGSGYNINALNTSTVSILDNDVAVTPPTSGGVLTSVGTSGNDDLVALPGTNFDGQANIVFTGAGNDVVDLSFAPTAHNNRIDLGSGNDMVYVSQNDSVFGGTGNDVFEATDGRGGNRMSGGAGNDLFFLGANDYALGGDGNDKFFAGTGGGNVISGGAGADQFWLFNVEMPTKPNTVLDFQVGTDVIGINDGGKLGFNDLTRTGETIAIGGTVIATLTGINTASLTASNFLFA